MLDKTDVAALEKGYYGASIMPVEVLREMQQRLPKVKLWNLYGQTEIAPLATSLGPNDQLRKAGSAGKACLNVETRVVDDDMRDVAVGAVGEIVHRSPQLLTGYYNDPDKTAAAFAGGWFHSGDLATIDAEGYITVVDRKKDMIKTGGENVASREVEEAIYLLPQVSEVAVIGLPDPRWIEAVTAIIVIKAGAVARRSNRRRALPRQARRLQDAEAHRLHRRPAEKPERQGPEAGSAGAAGGVRGGEGTQSQVGRRRRGRSPSDSHASAQSVRAAQTISSAARQARVLNRDGLSRRAA